MGEYDITKYAPKDDSSASAQTFEAEGSGLGREVVEKVLIPITMKVTSMKTSTEPLCFMVPVVLLCGFAETEWRAETSDQDEYTKCLATLLPSPNGRSFLFSREWLFDELIQRYRHGLILFIF
jgi:hypothetical protein